MEMEIDKYLTVAQDNRISQTAYAKNKEDDLTIYQKSLVLLAIARVKKDDQKFKIEKITFKEFMDIMNIAVGGNTERKIAESVQTLIDKSFFVKEAVGKETKLFWVNPDTTRIDWAEKIIFIQLNKELEKYFLNLDGHFTSFQLGFVTNFTGKYSFKVYEYLHSYLGLGKLIVKREDALKILGNGHYHHIADFDRYVLKKAVNEINEYSDIIVKYYRRIDRKTITHYFFTISKKDQEDIEMIQEKWSNRKSEYDEIAEDFAEFSHLYQETNKMYFQEENKDVYESEIL